MSPDELADLVESLIIAQDGKYANSIIRIQNELYDDLLATVKNLELDSEGYILQNNANRRILSEAEQKVFDIFNSPAYQTAVSSYVSIIPKLDVSNERYFQQFTSFKENKAFLKSLQSQTIENVEKYILQDGLESQVINPLVQIMNQNVNSGGRFSGFLQQIQDYVKGNDKVEGRALSYSRTYLRDSMFTYARTFQQAVTADIKTDWYVYSGGIMDKTRSFCVDRAGKYYHHSEIEKWADLQWQGKKQGTTESSIFLFAGGWNCGHQIIPVSTVIVPDEDLSRIG